MSEFLRVALLIEERWGKKSVMEMVSVFSGFIVPFLFWLQIYVLFPQIFIVTWVAYLGILVFSLVFLLVLYWNFGLIHYRQKLMKKIECRHISSAENKSEGKFEGEVDRFGVPYFYHEPLYSLASFTGGKLTKSLMVLISSIINTVSSYSIVVLLHAYASKDPIMSILSFCPIEVVQFFNFLIPQYLPHSILLFFCLSLLNRNALRFPRMSRICLLGAISLFLYAVSRVVCVVVVGIAFKLYKLRWDKPLITFPFIKTINPSLIIEKSMQNIEGTSCRVLQRNYEVVDAKDIETIKAIMTDEAEPVFWGFSSQIKSIKPSDVLNILKPVHPIFYLCMIGNKCAVIGAVFRCLTENAHMAIFDFDNKYVKEEFEKIMNKEIEKRRELK